MKEKQKRMRRARSRTASLIDPSIKHSDRIEIIKLTEP